MAEIQLRDVVKYYDDTPAVRGVNLHIADEEFVVLVGPSGCGKSTILRMIAGLEEVSEGDILIGGNVVTDLLPKDRDVAMVFQNYALYPHMSVRENMAFGLRQRRVPRDQIEQRVNDAARILDIVELLERRPRQLSGGQRQRVAMGRAIVRDPQVFLFDEPLSNLDAQLRVQMRTEIKKLRHDVRSTTVYVTHDQIEAMTLADRVVVMNRGRIEQVGTPHELYHAPKTRFVAAFIGSPTMNFLPVRIEDRDGRLFAALEDGSTLPLAPCRRDQFAPCVGRDALELGIRPEHVTTTHSELAPGFAGLDVTVEVTEPMGSETLVYFSIGHTPLCGKAEFDAELRDGERIRMAANLNHMHLIDAKSGLVL
jgi:multiple sugar transport system ATP-binding protein